MHDAGGIHRAQATRVDAASSIVLLVSFLSALYLLFGVPYLGAPCILTDFRYIMRRFCGTYVTI